MTVAMARARAVTRAVTMTVAMARARAVTRAVTMAVARVPWFYSCHMSRQPSDVVFVSIMEFCMSKNGF